MPFLLKSFTVKSHEELNQVNELATQQGYLCQSSSQASSCPNIFLNDENYMPEHHSDEKWSRLLKTQIEERIVN